MNVGASAEMNGVNVATIVSVGSARVGIWVGGSGVAVRISIAAGTGVAAEWRLLQAVEYNINAAITSLTFSLLCELMQLV